MRAIHTIAGLGLLLTACATGTASFDRETSPRTGVHLDFSAPSHDGTQRTFPAVVEPRLPSADRIAPRIRVLLGETASAAIKLCVAPDGHVASVALEKSSTMVTFDHAMMRDIAAWQFAAMPGPSTLRTCERFTISYRPHD